MEKRVSSLESLYPPFAEQVDEFIRKIGVAELHAHIFESYRSFERQEELYAKGREKRDGLWVVVDRSKIVTKAKPGRSFHAYGIASDFVFDGNLHKQGVQWNWEDADVTKPGKQPLPWKELGELGETCGLEWAGRWERFKEFPHFQNRYGFGINGLYKILMNDGLETVWKELDKKIKPEKTTITVPEVVVTPVEDPEKPLEEEKDEPVVSDDKSIDASSTKKSSSLFKLGLDIIMGILRIFAPQKRDGE